VTRWLPVLMARLNDLEQGAPDEDVVLNQDSMRHAISFARRYSAGEQPSAYLVGNGNVRFLFGRDWPQIGLQFLPDRTLQYVIFVEECTLPLAGVGSETDILAILRDNSLGSLLGLEQ